MRKTFTKIAGCAALGLLMCFNAPAITKAAVKTVPAKNGVYNAKVDMNGDGKADAIKITTSKDKNDYINKIKVTMNKKTVYSKSLKDSSFCWIKVTYANMSNSREFLQFVGHGDNDCITFNQIYTYNKKRKKLNCINSFNTNASYQNEIVAADKNYVTIHNSDQPAEVGWISWNIPYKYSKGKLVAATTSTTTVKSLIANNKKDKYSKYFAKNQFVTAKKLTFYNGSKVAYTVPKGKVVTLTKLSLSKDVIYLQFKYGKKTGWAHVNGTKYNFSKPWFQGVNARLAW